MKDFDDFTQNHLRKITPEEWDKLLNVANSIEGNFADKLLTQQSLMILRYLEEYHKWLHSSD